MCIRDRVKDGINSTTIIDDSYSSDFQSLKIALDFLESQKPVSYTHLRAHETVLDLVCRLLLEKKKTNQSFEGHKV